MELGKAIERCEELIKEEHSNWIGITNQEAIKALLQAVKNSIPKEVIEKKIEDCMNCWTNMYKEDYAQKQKDFPSQDVLVVAGMRSLAHKVEIDVLQELLEE